MESTSPGAGRSLPRAGADATDAGSIGIVRGFLINDSIIAQSVSIAAARVTLQLCGENDLQQWRMGRKGWKDN